MKQERQFRLDKPINLTENKVRIHQGRAAITAAVAVGAAAFSPLVGVILGFGVGYQLLRAAEESSNK